MNKSSLLFKFIITVCLFVSSTLAGSIYGIERPRCNNRNAVQKFQESRELTQVEQRLTDLRNEMRTRASSPGRSEIDAYIVTSYDEHQTYQADDLESRLQFISGFSGPIGDAVITQKSAALWTESKYLDLANAELECDWKIFVMGEDPSIPKWLEKQISRGSAVGSDAKTVPHVLWREWERELNKYNLDLLKVKNLIDFKWGRILKRDFDIQTHNSSFDAVKWQEKVAILRSHLKAHHCDAMVVTSLTEIAYLLNLRGDDFIYTPVFRAYLIVSQQEVILYTKTKKVTMQVQLKLNFDMNTKACINEKICVTVKDYDYIWKDLKTLPNINKWSRVLLPSLNVFDMGASEYVYSSLSREIILERTSPIVFMRAQKSEVEREGMRRAHIKDAVAMCETFSYLEERFQQGDYWNEMMLAQETDRSRYDQKLSEGLSFKTIVAYGPNAARTYYYPPEHPRNSTTISNTNMILVDSGGQYLDGTTSVARTIHLGEPTMEQKRAYTNVLTGLIRLSLLVFPDNIQPGEIDTLIRGPLWQNRHDYQHLSGHGIGSYLSAEESPINIAYTTRHKYVFKEGNFFTVAPGYYKHGDFGIRLKNVFEVVDTGDRSQESGAKFLAFRVATLVPFETKLIDKTLLSVQEKKWLNQYNIRIRETIGTELKLQNRMHAFYWLMNQTEHIQEFITESEYRKNNAPQLKFNFILIVLIASLKSLLH